MITPHLKEQIARFARLFVVTFVSTLVATLVAAVQALPAGTSINTRILTSLVVGAVVGAAEVVWRQVKPALPPGLPPPATAALAPLVGLLERVATAVEALGPTTVNVHPAVAAAEPAGPALTSTGAVIRQPLADAAAGILAPPPPAQPVAEAGLVTAVLPTVGQVVR